MSRNYKREAGWSAVVLLLLYLASGSALVVNRALKNSETYFPFEIGPRLGEISDTRERAALTEQLAGLAQELAQGKAYAKLAIYEGDLDHLYAVSGNYIVIWDKMGQKDAYVSLNDPSSADIVSAFVQEVRPDQDSLVEVSGYQAGQIIYPTEIIYEHYTLLEEPDTPGKDVPATSERKTLKLQAHPPREGLELVTYQTDSAVVFLGSGSDAYNSFADTLHASEREMQHVWKAFQEAAELEASADREALSGKLSELSLFDDAIFQNDNRQGGNLIKSKQSYAVCVREAAQEQPALYLTVHAVAYPLYDALSDLSMTLAFLFLFYLCVFILLLSNKFWKIYREQNAAAQRQHDFTNALAHEMKTPMSVIYGYGEMLHEKIEPSKQPEYVSGILRETEHMDELVSEILSFSRLDAKNLPLHPSACALDQMIRAQLRTYEPQMEDRRLRLLTDLPEGLFVNADEKELVIAVRNLISNAVKYTPEGGEIRVTLEKKRGKAIVEMHNQGPQIPKKDLPYLWDAFYRADESRTSGNGGVGMGLAVTKAILQRHNARFGVRNEVGGVCFWFAMPLRRNRKGGA